MFVTAENFFYQNQQNWDFYGRFKLIKNKFSSTSPVSDQKFRVEKCDLIVSGVETDTLFVLQMFTLTYLMSSSRKSRMRPWLYSSDESLVRLNTGT